MRILHLLVTLFLLVVPGAVRAQLVYTTNGASITITGYNGGPDNVVISNVIDGLPVTVIGNSAFRLTSITNVVIPNSVIVIGSGAFGFCNLQTVAIPDSVRTIGSGAFFSGYQMTDVSIGSGVTNIDIEAFDSCLHLTNITVSASNAFFTTVGGVLFNKSMTVIYQYPTAVVEDYAIPGTVTNIVDYAFSSGKMTGVTIPATLASFGDSTFRSCHNVTNFTVAAANPNYASTNGVLFNKALTLLMEYPVGNTAGAYVVPNSVLSIGGNAFEGATSLTGVTIPNNVTDIGGAAFQDDYALTTVTVGTGVTSLGAYAFSYCPLLTTANFMGNAPPDSGNAFYNSPTTVYRTVGKTGWGATFGTAPVVLLTPQLMIKQVGTNVVLTWPTNVAGFVLQSATNLGSAVWGTNAPNPVVVGGQNTVTNGILAAPKFYRLD